MTWIYEMMHKQRVAPTPDDLKTIQGGLNTLFGNVETYAARGPDRLVADVAYGADQRFVFSAQLGAQPSHVYVDGAWLDVHVLSPHEVEELQAVVHPVGMLHEELEELELPQRERHGLAVDGGLVSIEVDL